MVYNKEQTNKGDKGGAAWPGIKFPRQVDMQLIGNCYKKAGEIAQ